MSLGRESPRSHLTLILCTLLHTFTHAYGMILVPLYLLIAADLRLGGVKQASLIVTVYGFVYNLGSFAAGVLSDRFNRKALLGIGILGNAAAILLMGLTRRYDMLLALGALAGLAGTLFHPAANALTTAHYPRSPGMAIGLLGIGSGLGFFSGPQFAGWRAQSASWHWRHIADWQRPLVELGALGLIAGIVFLIVAREWHDEPADDPQHARRKHPPLGSSLRWKVIAIALTLGFRDFVGVAALTLVSIYLQKAFRLSVERAGFILGAITIPSILGNPLLVYLSPGPRRLRWLVAVLIVAALILASTPYWALAEGIAALTLFQFLNLGSYAISDAATLERVAPRVRGRIVGLYLTIAGTLGATGPFFMGWWTDALGSRAAMPKNYLPLFATLAALMAFASVSVSIIARLGQPVGSPISPMQEISPATMTE